MHNSGTQYQEGTAKYIETPKKIKGILLGQKIIANAKHKKLVILALVLVSDRVIQW